VPPPIVLEFGKKAQSLLERDGTVIVKDDGRRVLVLGMPPLWMLCLDSRPGVVRGLFVSLPGPIEDPTRRVHIYEDGNHGIYYDIVQIKHYLPMLIRHLILEELAAIPVEEDCEPS